MRLESRSKVPASWIYEGSTSVFSRIFCLQFGHFAGCSKM
jgi:hypothetical protein